MPDYANSARSVLEGLTFNNAAEMEAFIRAVARGNPGMYRQLKQQLDADYAKWSEENPKASLTGEFAGALLPGIVGAFLPGGAGQREGRGGRRGEVRPPELLRAGPCGPELLGAQPLPGTAVPGRPRPDTPRQRGDERDATRRRPSGLSCLKKPRCWKFPPAPGGAIWSLGRWSPCRTGATSTQTRCSVRL